VGALPKRRISKGRGGRRSSHLALKATQLVPCPQCHELILPHHVCPNCGSYKGTEVIEIKTKAKTKKTE
jgi:large subunit ribosomal protein L32